MKAAILGDTHWGCRNDLNLFYGYFSKFYIDFINYLIENDIRIVYQLGDLFDRRKYINFKTLDESKRIFFNTLQECGIELHVLVGNHDIHMRESVEINSPSLVLGEYNNIIVHSKPTTISLNDTTIDIVPWICKENEQDIMEFIAQSKSDLCLGHFEIENFSMYKGVESHEGLSSAIFEKYERVISGHYHTKSTRYNITYAGTPYEMTWQDYNDPKGFHIFDTETRELTFVENVHKLFVRIDYDDAKELVDLSTLSLTDCFVKLVVTSKTNLYKFDNFVQRLYGMGCYEIKIIEDMSEFSDGEVGDDIDLEDTMDVLSNYIDSIDTDADKDQIKQFMKTLYVEAVNVEVIE